jgi:acyl-coenzyme A thioesterase PaaI-like protein
MQTALNLYPPYWGTGIQVTHLAADYRSISVRMALRPYNQNYVGTQFGGSLYAMTDPFFMLMLIKNLGPHYIVWDKAATIHFLKPGRFTVQADFFLSPADLAEVKAVADRDGKTEKTFSVDIVTANGRGDTVARVEKLIYVRKKQKPGHSNGLTVPRMRS